MRLDSDEIDERRRGVLGAHDAAGSCPNPPIAKGNAPPPAFKIDSRGLDSGGPRVGTGQDPLNTQIILEEAPLPLISGALQQLLTTHGG